MSEYQLPEGMSPAVYIALSAYDAETQEAFMTHLMGGTAAGWLADRLRANGTPVGATTLKEARRRLREQEGSA